MAETKARQVLEPCPFCGDHEGVYLEGPSDDHPYSAIVRCSNCNAVHCCTTIAETIAAWNRRASDPAVAEAMKLAGRIAEAADIYLVGMEDGPVDTDERHDQVQRLAAAHRTLNAIGPLETAILARALLAKYAAKQEKDHG